MRHYLQSIFTLLIAMMWTVGGYAQSWEKTELADLTSTDVFLIVDLNSKTAMTNNNGTSSAPSASKVTLSDDNATVTSSVTDDLKWNVANDNGSYVFYPNGSTTKWLYCKSDNNGVRVGADANKTFTTYASGNYSGLYNTGQKRYIGVYNSKDWRCYTTVHNNIKATSIAYYKYSDGSSSSKTATTLTFPQSSVTFSTTDDDLTTFSGQTATLTANDEEVTGKTITYAKSGDDIFTSFDESTGALTLNGSVGTATITATFDGSADETYLSSSASYTVSVKQVIADIATLKPLITGTSSTNPEEYTLKLTDAIVTYKSGNYMYIEDATGGLYSSATGASSLAVNDKINGLVTLKAYKNQGQTQVNNWVLDAAATIEHDATFTPTTVTLAELTADMDKYENMRVKVEGATVSAAMNNNQTTITQGDASITLYDKAKNSSWTLAADDNVDVEGYPCTYNKVKELCVWKKSDVTINASVVATTITLDPATAEYTVVKGKENLFQAPTATVTDANNETVADAALTYASSNTDVATVAADGAITLVGVGTTVITVSYAGDATHKAAADVSYKIIYGKVNPTMAWSETEVTGTLGETFTAPTLSLKDGDEDILSGKTITYESSKPAVATVAEDGTVTLVDEGTTTITASYAGDDTYADVTASYTLTVTDPNKLVATFDFMNPSKYGYGVTDKNPTYGEGEGDVLEGATMTEGDVTLTNTIQSGNGTRFYDDGLRMYAGNTHTLSVPAGYRITSVAFGGSKASYSYTIGDADANTSWTGSAKSLDIVYNGTNKKVETLTVTYKKVTLPALTLTETDNDLVILENEDAYANVTVSRTLIADGAWYTLCLPFDVDDVTATPLKDAELRQYKSVTGTTMNFEATTSLKAYHAYLVKPTADITNPVFEDVKVVIEGDNVVDGSDGYKFVGVVSEATLTTDGTNLFLGDNNKFYVPTEDDCKIKALRGYFVVPEGAASKASINIEGETTAISGLHTTATQSNGKVYNLNGQYLGTDVNTLQKGIYLVNGKKLIVK